MGEKKVIYNPEPKEFVLDESENRTHYAEMENREEPKDKEEKE